MRTATVLFLIVVLSRESIGRAAERVYVGTSDRVSAYDTSGHLLSSISIGRNLIDVAISHQGEVYVLTQTDEPFGHAINMYSPNGTWTEEIVSRVGGLMLGLTIGPDDNLYFGFKESFSGGRQFSSIERYSPEGNSLGVFSTVSTLSNGSTYGIDFDSSQRMYVTTDEVVEMFNVSGNSLGKWPTRSSLLVDLDVDTADTVRVASYYNSSVLTFDASGRLLASFMPQMQATSLASDSEGVLYVGGRDAENGVSVVKTFTSDGTPLGAFAAPFARQVMSVEVVTVVPEPSRDIARSCG